MASKKAHSKLIDKPEAIKTLAEESAALLRAQSGSPDAERPGPDMEKLLAILQAQAGLQQALLEKLLEVMNPTEKEKDLSDTFQLAVQELLDYFQERVRLASKKADAAALKHLRKG